MKIGTISTISLVTLWMTVAIIACNSTTTESDLSDTDSNSSSSSISTPLDNSSDDTESSISKEEEEEEGMSSTTSISSMTNDDSSYEIALSETVSSSTQRSSNTSSSTPEPLSSNDRAEESDSANLSSSVATITTVGSGNWESGEIPASIMRNYKQWKITFPDASEIKDLENVKNEFFYVEDDAIVFYTPITDDNNPTDNSTNIRSELRERKEDGSSDVYWTTDGTHILYVKQAITHLPIVKNHLVATQIHGNKEEGIDDAMVLRLEGQHLFLSFNGGKLRDDLTIKTDYILGTIHEVIFKVVDGKHFVYYSEDGTLNDSYRAGTASHYQIKDGTQEYVLDLDYDESYFKVGNYTQSNPKTEGDSTNNPDNYGEVKVWDFWVEHL